MPSVTAVVVTYRSKENIGRLLRKLALAHEQALMDGIVVSNDAADGVAEWVRGEHPWVRVVQNDSNLGFGRGCNVGFELVDTPYLLLVNPDATIEPEAVQKLLAFMENVPEAGIAAPAIIDGAGELQYAGVLPTPTRLLRAAAGCRNSYPDRRPIIPGQPPFRTSWLCGAVMMIRSSLFARLGGFDPRYFLYFEETDFCRRVARAGAELWAVGEALAEHVGGASAQQVSSELYFNCLPEHYFRSRFYYLVKHHGYAAAAATDILEYGLLAARYIGGRVRGKADSSGFRARGRAGLWQLPAAV